METAVLISILVSMVLTGVGLGLVLFALKYGGRRQKRNPELARKVAEAQDWEAFDAIMTPRKRDLPES